MPWQPGAAAVGSGRKSPGPRITPEEFAQRRASSNRVASPVFALHKNRSTGQVPQERPVSADWSKRKEVGSRLSSGDVSAMLAEQQDYSNHLSAREQEHLAKMTNSPLVNVNSRRNQGPQAAGLVGAIEAREQEKKQVRQGISGQMVQRAIAQRQQQAQQQYQAYQQQMAYQQGLQQASSPQAQAYEAQMAVGFSGQPQPQPRSTQSSPGGWVMQPSPQQWPNGQTQTYWAGMQPQRQMQQQRGQFVGSEKQGYMGKASAGQK
jgi:CCR4-NOT transcriptional complex subunit CAF120